MPKGGHKHEAKHEAKEAKHEAKHEAKEAKHEAKHEAREAREQAREERQDTRADDRDISKILAEFQAADEVYFADINELNSSRVEGFAFITVERNGPGSADDVINVRMVAENLQAGLHIKHIHGFEDGREAVTPTVEVHDTDGDGIIELAEGAPAYGPILVNLKPFDTFTSDGSSLVFNRSFHLPSGEASHDNAAHSGDEVTTFDNLDLNHFVIHGLRVPTGVGRDTPGEVGVDDLDDYKEVLPAAVGEIDRVSVAQAETFLRQAYAEGFDFI